MVTFKKFRPRNTKPPGTTGVREKLWTLGIMPMLVEELVMDLSASLPKISIPAPLGAISFSGHLSTPIQSGKAAI